jgi:protein gp37
MADVFEDRRDLDQRREKLWGLIEETPNLEWLLLTKRPENVAHLAPWGSRWPANIWLGTTTENQRWLEARLPVLTSLNARILFLSCEPLLGPLDLSRWIEGAQRGEYRKIDWIIGGGESGHHARPMHPEWLTSLRDQCLSSGIRFYFKQWGNWRPIGPRAMDGFTTRELLLSNGSRIRIANMGKKAAGRRLQQRTWSEFPDAVG